ncbi:MAG: co-chaperone YbbN [Nocardioidaceae bacterium]|nr:co-chaperone YbbN [Nocardioidaceae bacterium]
MSFSRPGAIDLSAFKQPPAAPAGPPAPPGSSFVIEVTEQNFQNDALQASMQHIVVLNLWSTRSAQAAEFNGLLATVVNSYGGQILLANVDVDTSPSIAQALQAQGVPFVVGIIAGQPVPLFQSTAAETDVRRLFDELIKVAAQNGITGRAAPVGSSSEPVDQEPVEDPRFAEADAAFGAGDFPTAIAAYEKLIAQNPADAEAAERLAGIRLISRTQGVDLQEARKAAADDPADIDAQLLVADLDVSGGHVEDAFDRLITTIKTVFGDDRERVRQRLIELFSIVGSDDPRVALARRKLATALY